MKIPEKPKVTQAEAREKFKISSGERLRDYGRCGFARRQVFNDYGSDFDWGPAHLYTHGDLPWDYGFEEKGKPTIRGTRVEADKAWKSRMDDVDSCMDCFPGDELTAEVYAKMERLRFD